MSSVGSVYWAAMTMGLRRLMLGIGAALLVGGWGAWKYIYQAHEALGPAYGSIKVDI